MKTIQEVKDEIAFNHEYYNWEAFLESYYALDSERAKKLNELIDEAMQLFKDTPTLAELHNIYSHL